MIAPTAAEDSARLEAEVRRRNHRETVALVLLVGALALWASQVGRWRPLLWTGAAVAWIVAVLDLHLRLRPVPRPPMTPEVALWGALAIRRHSEARLLGWAPLWFGVPLMASLARWPEATSLLAWGALAVGAAAAVVVWLLAAWGYETEAVEIAWRPPLSSDRLRLVPIGRRHLGPLRDLWTDPAVMGPVGYPDGLDPADLQMERYLATPRRGEVGPHPARDHRAVELCDGAFAGEAYIPGPGPDRFAEPDLKLAAHLHGRGIGAELAELVVGETFRRHPHCLGVRFTPRSSNRRAIALYERLGCDVASIEEDAEGTQYLVMQIRRDQWGGPEAEGTSQPSLPTVEAATSR